MHKFAKSAEVKKQTNEKQKSKDYRNQNPFG